MFIVLYKWHARPGKEAAFEQAWHRGTIAITRKYGSFGSRLCRTAEGAYVGMAEWPSEDVWRDAMAQHMAYDDPEAREMFLAATADGGEPVMTLTLVDDLLTPRALV